MSPTRTRPAITASTTSQVLLPPPPPVAPPLSLAVAVRSAAEPNVGSHVTEVPSLVPFVSVTSPGNVILMRISALAVTDSGTETGDAHDDADEVSRVAWNWYRSPSWVSENWLEVVCAVSPPRVFSEAMGRFSTLTSAPTK